MFPLKNLACKGLIFYMLNYFEECKKNNLAFLYHCLTFRWHRSLKIVLMEDEDLFLQHSQLPRLWMTWRNKEPGHQQPWYWQGSVRWNIPVSAPVDLNTLPRNSEIHVLSLFGIHQTLHSQKTPSTLPWIHWGQMMHKSVSKLTITGSDNGLLPNRAKPFSKPMLVYC